MFPTLHQNQSSVRTDVSFALTISGESITIDTGIVYIGPPIGTDTTGQGAEGPPCVGG